MHIGIFPGTFDPIHQGHLSFATETAKSCHLDKIYLLPEPHPRGKPLATPLAKRLLEIERIVGSRDNLEVLLSPFNRSSTADTLPWLKSQFPNATFTLLIGSDIARHLNTWTNINILTGKLSFAIGMREGADKASLLSVIEQIEHEHNIKLRHSLITTAHPHVASSKIRATR